jgi:hypothetical protein
MTTNIQRLSLRRGATMFGLIASLLCAAPAFASTIDFETLPNLDHIAGDTLSEAGFNLRFVSGAWDQLHGVTDSPLGLVADAANPDTCFVYTCPAGASGNYLNVLSDGAIQISRAGPHNGFTLGGFDFSFLAFAGTPPGDYGQVRLRGVLWNGTTVSTSLAFPGADSNGNFAFGAAQLDPAFRHTIFSSLSIDACLYDANSVCVNSVDEAIYQRQFSIDNISLNEVPEPASFLLAGLGLGALGLARRRRSVRSTSL